MSRTLPLSTLFPYTTLFRSVAGERVDIDGVAGAGDCARSQGQRIAFVARGTEPRVIAAQRRRVSQEKVRHENRLRRPEMRDRKSTRLNSSHRTISYAVFCLK